ncbi:phage terminase large subunit GpA-like protein [Puniceicoccus vermicola]
MLDLAADPQYRETWAVCGSQIGKTLFLRVLMAYYAYFYGGPQLTVFPTLQNALEFSEHRWQTLVEASPVLRELVPEARSDYKKLSQILGRAKINFTGGGSSANLRSLSIRWLFLDEIEAFSDGFSLEKEGETTPLELIRDRVKAFGNFAKQFYASTPKTDDGPSWRGYCRGTQHQYFVSSPYALDEEKFLLETPMVKCDPRAKVENGYDWKRLKENNAVWIECPYTKKPIYSAQRNEMLHGGEWRQTNPDAEPDILSLNISSLYSPTVSLNSYFIKFLKGQDSPAAMQAFCNGYEAQPFSLDYKSQRKEEIQNCILPYSRGEHEDAKYRIITIDVQKDWFYFVCRGYGRNGSYLLDYGKLYTHADIDDLIEKYQPIMTGIDNNYAQRSNEMNKFVYDRISKGRKICTLRGWESIKSGKPFEEKYLNPFVGTSKQKWTKKILNIWINNDIWKSEVHNARSGNSNRWFVFDGVGDDYVDMLFAESPREIFDKNGKKKIVWKQRRKRNEAFDVECYNAALALYCGVEKTIQREITLAKSQEPEEILESVPEPEPKKKITLPPLVGAGKY